jgi:hypothetical protein
VRVEREPGPQHPYDEQFLISRKRLDALREAFDEIFLIFRGGPAGDSLHDTEYVLGAMIGLTHQKGEFVLRKPSAWKCPSRFSTKPGFVCHAVRP